MQSNEPVGNIHTLLNAIGAYLETFQITGPVVDMFRQLSAHDVCEAYPMTNLNPDEPLTSLLQDAASRDFIELTSYLCNRSQVSDVERLLMIGGIQLDNPYFNEGSWEEMVTKIASVLCTCSECQ